MINKEYGVQKALGLAGEYKLIISSKALPCDEKKFKNKLENNSFSCEYIHTKTRYSRVARYGHTTIYEIIIKCPNDFIDRLLKEYQSYFTHIKIFPRN